MNEKLRLTIAGQALMAISDLCDDPEEIQDVIDEMQRLHSQVMKGQRKLLGGWL
jgi:hypothetical protein